MSNLYNPRLYILRSAADLTLVPGYTTGPTSEEIPVPGTPSFGVALRHHGSSTEVTIVQDAPPGEWPTYIPLKKLSQPPAWLVQLGHDPAANQFEALMPRLTPQAQDTLMALVEKHTCMRVAHYPPGVFKLEFKPATSHEMRPVEIPVEGVLQFFSAEAEA